MDIQMDYFPFWLRYGEEWDAFGMTDAQFGCMVKAAMKYMTTGEVPDFSGDKLCFIVWTYMKKDLDNAHERYATAVENGRKNIGKRKKKQDEATDNQDESKTNQGVSKTNQGVSKTNQGASKTNQGASKTNQGASKTNPDEPISKTKTKTESKTKTKSLSKSKAKTESEPETPSKAVEPEKPERYGDHGWIELTPAEYGILSRQMGKIQLDHYIRCVDHYVHRTRNAPGYRDWQGLILKFYNEKMFHSTLPGNTS